MKKLLVMLVTIALLCGACAALAELPDLQGALPDINIALPTILAPLPDPAESLGSVGTAFQSDFEYNGETYDLYVYPIPDALDAFLDAYTAACEGAGYEVEQGTETGNSALFVSGGDARAILLTDYQGYMLLMVPEGLDFTLRDAVQPTEPPVVKMNYMELDYDGYHYESMAASTMDIRMDAFGVRVASMYFSFGGVCPFDSIWMEWPAYAHVGDTFTVTKADGEGSSYADPRKDCLITFELSDREVLKWGKIAGLYYDYSASSDYFTLTITKSEQTDEGYLIEGDIECQIASQNDTRKVEIKNCHFSAITD